MERLTRCLEQYDRVCVAVSGGCDSSLLLAVAVRALGVQRVLAVTAVAPLFIDEEVAAAGAVARDLGVQQVMVQTHQLSDPRFTANTPERCAYCKASMMQALKAAAEQRGYAMLMDGSNATDVHEHRPGLQAALQAGVRQPLRECGLDKPRVRALARRLGVRNWDRPQNACLASRLPYGEAITVEKLERVAAAEAVLHELAFSQCRVRHHGPLARVEVEASRIAEAVRLREHITPRLLDLGFTYVTVDLVGYRSGSLDETLPADE